MITVITLIPLLRRWQKKTRMALLPTQRLINARTVMGSIMNNSQAGIVSLLGLPTTSLRELIVGSAEKYICTVNNKLPSPRQPICIRL